MGLFGPVWAEKAVPTRCNAAWASPPLTIRQAHIRSVGTKVPRGRRITSRRATPQVTCCCRNAVAASEPGRPPGQQRRCNLTVSEAGVKSDRLTGRHLRGNRGGWRLASQPRAGPPAPRAYVRSMFQHSPPVLAAVKAGWGQGRPGRKRGPVQKSKAGSYLISKIEYKI